MEDLHFIGLLEFCVRAYFTAIFFVLKEVLGAKLFKLNQIGWIFLNYLVYVSVGLLWLLNLGHHPSLLAWLDRIVDVKGRWEGTVHVYVGLPFHAVLLISSLYFILLLKGGDRACCSITLLTCRRLLLSGRGLLLADRFSWSYDVGSCFLTPFFNNLVVEVFVATEQLLICLRNVQ